VVLGSCKVPLVTSQRHDCKCTSTLLFDSFMNIKSLALSFESITSKTLKAGKTYRELAHVHTIEAHYIDIATSMCTPLCIAVA
jgi:hypothetical protein